ncbi:hypothetical protein BDP27DRAFT_1317085 [Rhodocollybia butyracea]|uniref:Uncharacterized protein n=1 Tax=Rhodocollybia butyracea TaxID=206335 RepID=A0A9P5Q4G2_9AGAR|nr:hypothetical protein BDP27DRAFT_1317085 [Rhodocollybia butyracea]
MKSFLSFKTDSTFRTPLKKIGTTYDTAAQIVLLASTKIINISGGMEGRLLNKPEDI